MQTKWAATVADDYDCGIAKVLDAIALVVEWACYHTDTDTTSWGITTPFNFDCCIGEVLSAFTLVVKWVCYGTWSNTLPSWNIKYKIISKWVLDPENTRTYRGNSKVLKVILFLIYYCSKVLMNPNNFRV